MKRHLWLVLTILALFGCASGKHAAFDPPPPDAAGSSDDLQAARDAFAAGDYLSMVQHLEKVLRDAKPGSLREKSALELVDEAYSKNGSLPADFTLPAEAGQVTVHFRSLARLSYIDGSGQLWTDSGGRRRTIWLESTSDSITSVRLVRSTGDVILDSDVGIGMGDDGIDPAPAAPSRVIWQRDIDDDHQDGLYDLTLGFAGGSTVTGAIIVTRALAAESPSILNPTVDRQLFTVSNPEIRVSNFVSPEFLGIETRDVDLNVVQTGQDPIYNPNDPGNAASPVASVWATREALTSLSPDDSLSFTHDLSDGGYRVTAALAESRAFGPIAIARDSALQADFHVRTTVPAPDQLPGSCHGSCGGKSSTGSCWCDEPCLTVAGQCCFDKQSFCGGLPGN